ncbi:PQQ-binding-like beta-propeller repeat protein [Treponema sp. OMZ 840]|uniref:outer membrane protein assembly factor BamB family protein n=1 Tax=Treponema sp. OMZ 840 TaxID=244313 RepID=UPI003D8F97A1
MKAAVQTVKRYPILFLFCAAAVFVFGQTPSNKGKAKTAGADDASKPLWQSVLGGDAVSSPKRTSYGFVGLSEGKILSACTGNGTVIWRRSLPDSPSAWFTVSAYNFIYLVSEDGTKLALYNPDGIMLWQTVLEEKAVSDPLCGRDGRVFIAGKNSLSCYGTQGTKKWTLSLPQAGRFALQEMNDGSVLYIPEAKKNGASMGIRISPYGELIEDIVFTAEISCLASHESGLILGFKTGTVGCASVLKSVTKTLWSIPPQKSGSVPGLIIPGSQGFCVLYSDFTLCEYDFQKRSVLWSAQNSRLKPGENFFAAYDTDSYLFAHTAPSGTYAASYTAAGIPEQNEKKSNGGAKNGGTNRDKRDKKDESKNNDKADKAPQRLLWEREIKTAADSRFPLITSTLHLIVCGKNWVVSAYDLKNKNENIKPPIYDFEPYRIQNYAGFTNTIERLAKETEQAVRSARYEKNADVAEHLRAGNYGVKEYGYKKRIQNALNSYAEDYLLPNRRSTDTVEKTTTLALMAQFETTDFNYAVPLFLKNEEEPVLLAAAMRCAGSIGYDPDGKMLEAIEHLYATKKTVLPDPVLVELAEAVYALCRYMGRPAFIKRGKAVLSDMLTSGKSGSVQNKVRAVMLRFIALEQ